MFTEVFISVELLLVSGISYHINGNVSKSRTSKMHNVQETQKTVSLLNKWGLKLLFFLNTVVMFH